jgi:flagellar basal body rod protein FlgC
MGLHQGSKCRWGIADPISLYSSQMLAGEKVVTNCCSGVFIAFVKGSNIVYGAYLIQTPTNRKRHTMASVSSISLSGMNAAQTQLDSSAHNIANSSTPEFRRQQVVQTEQKDAGVSTSLTKAADAGHALESDLVAQLQAKNAFLANLAVFKTSNQMAGALLDKTA